MSKLELPSLSLKVKVEEVKDLVQDELNANNWDDIQVPAPELELVPYYVFHYDSYSETEEEKSKIRNVHESVQGTSSLNAVKNSLDDVIAEMVNPDMIQPFFEEPAKTKVTAKNPRFSLDEAKGAAQIKIAAQEKVPRGNVHVSGMRLVYIPFWVYKIILDEDNDVKLRINAVSGEFEGEESGIPYQGSTATELAKETISDLRSAEGWSSFVGNLVNDFLLLFQPNKEHPNRWMMILILLLIALFLLALGFVNLPTPE